MFRQQYLRYPYPYQAGELPLEIQAELPTVEQLQQALDFSESNSDLPNEGEL